MQHFFVRVNATGGVAFNLKSNRDMLYFLLLLQFGKQNGIILLSFIFIIEFCRAEL